jgi:hypothetical protein
LYDGVVVLVAVMGEENVDSVSPTSGPLERKKEEVDMGGFLEFI